MIATPPAVLIDCDPGIDDCLALMYLAGLHQAGEIELVGVTTTAGNVEAYQTAANVTAWTPAYSINQEGRRLWLSVMVDF